MSNAVGEHIDEPLRRRHATRVSNPVADEFSERLREVFGQRSSFEETLPADIGNFFRRRHVGHNA